ncbi:hypothetical protein BJ973_004446 [Actinoplanes tereljensis]|nr:hypothetical protein [Actinoplanes tereljensis]
MARDFLTVLRGYEKRQVDTLINSADAALTGDAAQRAVAREALRTAKFEIALRGYDRLEVDKAVQALLRELDSLAATDEFRTTLASVLRLSQPTDQQIIDEVRRLRGAADR